MQLSRIICLLFLFVVSFTSSFAQAKKAGWHLLDPKQDGYYGISLAKAYELLKGRKSNTVIVAVIDSGIDTVHEDLQSVLWVNVKEKPGNGKDDDGNGYVDDIYGWNFCGAKTGENLSRNTHEIARVYHNWMAEFKGKNESEIPADRKFLYGQWKKAESIIEADYIEASKNIRNITSFYDALIESSQMINKLLGSTEFTVNRLRDSAVRTVMARRAVDVWTNVLSQVNDTSITSTAVIADVAHYKSDLEAKKKRYEQAPEDLRGELVKDNYTDINDRYYGNSNLKEGSGNHGTSVSGTIAAIRNNGIGMDGIADNVRIMAIRAVPGGDEHDKDVALAIRYAVDNGASVINMSFGKPVSPYKQFVDDAVRYAASKGVLLVHGSGNEGKDISKDVFYPNPLFLDGKRAENFITVGASGDKTTGGIAASFSNYSNRWVDIFAPGVYIYTTTTNNGYEGADGTSLAAPVVSGVAALLKSYFPSLTPQQLIKIISETGTTVEENVSLPGDPEKKVSFATLSSSGRIINAYEAVKKAIEMEKK